MASTSRHVISGEGGRKSCLRGRLSGAGDLIPEPPTAEGKLVGDEGEGEGGRRLLKPQEEGKEEEKAQASNFYGTRPSSAR